MEDFPAYLRRHLDQATETPSDLARRSGISNSRISRWLAGTAVPSVDNSRALAEAYNLPIWEVLVAAGIVTEQEAKEAVGKAPRRPGPVDLAALSVDQLLREVRRRMVAGDGDRAMTRAEAEADGMIRGRVKRGQGGAAAEA